MSGHNTTRNIVIALVQLFLILLAVIASYHLTRSVNIIPKAVLHLPDVHVSQSDMWSVVKIFLITYLLQIGFAQWRKKDDGFASTTRFASEYVYYLFAYTTASLYLFIATTINYDPQFVAGIGLFSTLFYFIAFPIINTFTKNDAFFGSLFGMIGSVLKRMVSISGVLALAYFLVPLIMGKAFTANRDVANVITQVRIWFNPVGDTDWGFKNRLPGQVFAQPVLVKQAPNDTENLYVLERGGKVYKVSLSDPSDRELVVDVSELMGEVEVENGAVGWAFHPDFANQPYAFMYYTDTRPEGFQYNRLSRFDLSSELLNTRNASETILMELKREASGFHNGGSLEFGPDGYLYFGIGEGVRVPEAGTSDKILRAGILRLDVDINSQAGLAPEPFEFGTVQNYRVPSDNPFVGNDQIRNEYWAMGLRNPFRFTFDEQTGDMWLGDIGSTIWEEINKIEKGKHYQFPFVEGYNESGVPAWEELNLPEQGPVYTYEHNAYDRAVIGGVVNRSTLYEGLENKYIFADNYSAKIFVMDSDKERVEEVQLIARANQYAQRGVSSVVQLDNGEILITTLGAASEPSGEVLQLVNIDEANVFRVEEEDNTPKDYDEAATAALFSVNCGRCHGVTGDGKGPDSKLLGVEMPDLTSPLFHYSRSSDDIKLVIEKGGPALGKSPLMPPWEGFLKPQEIDNLVIYIESLPDKHHKH